jgi:hypothetical protein
MVSFLVVSTQSVALAARISSATVMLLSSVSHRIRGSLPPIPCSLPSKLHPSPMSNGRRLSDSLLGVVERLR